MIGLFNGALDCPLLPLDAPCGFLLGGDEVAFDRPLHPGEVFGLVDLEGGFAILQAMNGEFLGGVLTLRQFHGPVQDTASTCVHCGTKVEVTLSRDATCPGCGRRVAWLGAETGWHTVFDRAFRYRNEHKVKGAIVLVAKAMEDGPLRGSLFLQPDGATRPEECVVLIDECFERPEPIDFSGMSAGEKADAAAEGNTFARMATWVEENCGGISVIGLDGMPLGKSIP